MTDNHKAEGRKPELDELHDMIALALDAIGAPHVPGALREARACMMAAQALLEGGAS